MNTNETYFFNEKWKEKAREYAADMKVRISDYDPKAQNIYVPFYNIVTTNKKEPAPIFMREWGEKHPFPNCTMMDFVYQLGQRIANLETKLAQKGGEK